MDQKDSLGDETPPHEPFDPSSTHSTPSPHSSLDIANDIDGVAEPDDDMDTLIYDREECERTDGAEEESLVASSPDYEYLAATDDLQEEESLPASSPDYDHLAADMSDTNSEEQANRQPDPHKPLEAPAENEYEYVIHDGEEYILGTLMVRVLQAKNVQLDHRMDAGGISSLLSNHRRARHKKYTQSPLSGGALTPSSQATLYCKLTFNSQQQYSENAVPGMNGDYYWSRGDQSYFDVVCPSYARVSLGKKKVEKKLDDEEKKIEEDDAVCCKSSKIQGDVQKPQGGKIDSTAPPLLNLSLFAKKGSKGGKQLMSPSTKKKGSEFNEYDGESQYVGDVSINITRVLTGKTPYFDEWCTLHNGDIKGLEEQEDGAGRVRVVIEYEPTDSPPRSGDVCIFANIFPAMEKELYPIPLYSVQTNRPVFHRSGSITSFDKTTSASSTTLSSAGSASLSSKSTTTAQLVRQPKQFNVEECVGDHCVLSYTTPENWSVTFEIHRYNLLVTHRYCGTAEKIKESLLDFCDNISQSPMAGVVVKTAETIPDEGLLYVGAEAVGAASAVLGRWMEVGLEGAINDVVDAANLDGRYSHLSDEEDDEDNENEEAQQQSGDNQTSPLKSSVARADLEVPSEEKKTLPGMPDCPITGQPMIEPVVAADGHTYERYAIARWFQTSNRSPLTGAVMSHANLVPNYLLLSSLGGSAKKSET